MLIVAKKKTHIQNLKAQLKMEFDMKDLGEAKKIWVWRSVETGVHANSNYPRRIIFSRC